MNDKELLSEQEIDALLSGVSEDDSDSPASDESKVKPHNLVGHKRPGRGRFPGLERMAERFTRQWRQNLDASFRFPFELGANGTSFQSFGELVQSLAVPTAIHIIRIKPFSGNALVVLEAGLIQGIVDLYFGGKGLDAPVTGRDLSLTEKRIADRVATLFCEDLVEAWNDLLTIEVERVSMEVNPTLISQFTDEDTMLQISFPVRLPVGGGQVHLAIPYASLEPYEKRFCGDRNPVLDQGESWKPSLEINLLEALIPLHCSVATAQVPLGELLALNPGDILPLQLPETHKIYASGVPAFIGKMGESRGKLALEILDNASLI